MEKKAKYFCKILFFKVKFHHIMSIIKILVSKPVTLPPMANLPTTLWDIFFRMKNIYHTNQINFLFVANVVFQCYHFSKQYLSNLSKIKYFAFFAIFCFVVSLAKMVTLTNNIVYKKSANVGNIFETNILLPLRTIYFRTFFCETPCRMVGF